MKSAEYQFPTPRVSGDPFQAYLPACHALPLHGMPCSLSFRGFALSFAVGEARHPRATLSLALALLSVPF